MASQAAPSPEQRPSLPPSSATSFGKGAQLVSGRLIVKPPAGVTGAAARGVWLQTLSQTIGAPTTLRRPLSLGWWHVDVALPAVADRGAAERATLLLVEQARKTPGIRGVTAEWILRPLRAPDDPLFEEYMWHLDAIGMREAWDMTTGRSTNRVGVVDTGTLFDHEDLQGKRGPEFDFVTNDPIDIDGDGRGDLGRAGDGDGRDDDASDPGDGCGVGVSSFHGTHVGGTILANGDNGRGIAGINWGARLVTGRALGCGGGSSVDINEAVLWMGGFQVDGVPPLAAADRPRVINLSLGTTGAVCAADGTPSPDGRPIDPFTFEVFRAVAGAGVLLVVASGNDGNGVPVGSPANCDAAIAVAAFGPDRTLTAYSNFGPEIDIVAPGGDIDRFQAPIAGVLSSTDGSRSQFQGGLPYAFEQGTSMAAPHVAGVLSLVLDVNPNLTRDGAVALLQRTGDACANCQGRAALRADQAIAEAAGTEVITEPGDSCAGTGFCSNDQRCINVDDAPVCLLVCATVDDCAADEDCTAVQGGGNVCVPGDGGGGGGGGGGSVDGDCDPRRGHMDCAVGTGCVEKDGVGSCVDGADGYIGIGGLCDGPDDCSTGLCDRGVCTSPCDDEGCRDGYICDEAASVPGGLCRPESCADDPDICGGGDFDCSYSSASRYVCAVGPSNYRGVCGAQPAASAVVGMFALVLLLLRRRR
jgi:serine protease